MITVNLTKARDLTKDSMRQHRKSLLEEQDVLYMKALEAGEDTTEIVTEKQRLRDLTKLADDVSTVDELKTLKETYPIPEG